MVGSSSTMNLSNETIHHQLNPFGLNRSARIRQKTKFHCAASTIHTDNSTDL